MLRQRPSCALSRRRVERSSGGGGCLRRRVAQYWVRAGSSGEAVPVTIWWRTIVVQENLRR